jgi:hypothetical protein
MDSTMAGGYPATLALTGSDAYGTGYQRVDGLFDLRLARGRGGGLVLPGLRIAPTARELADLVVESSAAGDDIRVLLDDGESWLSLFAEMAALVGHDVLVTPRGARLRRTPGTGVPVPVDRSERPVDWVLVQPPQLATALPGWFALCNGQIRPRTGIVSLPLPDGLALVTRADFIARRAAAARLVSAPSGLSTVAVTVRAGAFVIGYYGGGDDVHGGRALAAALADLPLYGTDLRLWLTWPAGRQERQHLSTQLTALAETLDGTVWAPPVGGTARVLPKDGDLVALDESGRPHGWLPHRPAEHRGRYRFETDAVGRLVPARSPTRPGQMATGTVMNGRTPRVTVRPVPLPGTSSLARPETLVELETTPPTPAAGAGTNASSTQLAWRGRPGASVLPVATVAALLAPTVARPALVVEPGPRPPHGVDWLPERPLVNAAPVDLYLVSSLAPHRAAELGVPAPDLYLPARLFPRPVHPPNPSGYLLRVHVQRGGAVDLSEVGVHVPAKIQHLVGVSGVYLLPAGWLDRATIRASAVLHPDGEPGQEQPVPDAPLLLRCAGAGHGVEGLPNEASRWPRHRASRAYALMPDHAVSLPSGWLVLHQHRPPVRPGHQLLQVRVPRQRAIDLRATATRLAPLRSVRSRLDHLGADVQLILPRRCYDKVSVLRVLRPVKGSWRGRRPPHPLPLTALVQIRDRTRTAG